MKSYNNEKGIISLTSWKARINTVHITINSILNMCPDWHIVLVLSEDEFPQKEKELPVSLTFYPIEILWVKRNYKAFKKVAFTLKKYPNVPVCTADDDIVYTCNYADELYNKWIEVGQPRCCINYVQSPQITFLGPCMLYYNIDFPVEALSDNEINHSNDDPWMYYFAQQHNIPIYTCGHKKAPFAMHNDIQPLHPKFKSEFMNSIQHISTEEFYRLTLPQRSSGTHLVLLQYKYNRNSNELLYALSGLKKHARFDYELYIFGDKCPYLAGTEFEHVPVIEGDHGEYPKCRGQHIRVMKDLMTAYRIFKDRYDEFLIYSDDFFAINDFTWEDMKVPKYNSNTIKGQQYINPEFWARAKWKGGQMLAKKGIVGIDFTTHMPMVWNFEQLAYVCDKYNLTCPPNDAPFEDLVGNEFLRDCKLEISSKWNYRVTQIKDKITLEAEIRQAKEFGKKFINTAEGGWIPTVENFLKMEYGMI